MAAISTLINAPLKAVNDIANYISLKRGRVIYKSFPLIYGTIILKNNGVCQFGDNLIFRSSTSSNYVGLTKKCSVFIEPGAKLIIGDNAGLSGTTIYCANSITIGRYVNFGGNVCIWDTDFHPLDFEDRRVHNENRINSLPVVIGDDVFVGANAMILKGVKIGDRSIIGAGSVVTKSIPEDEIWAGNPARFIKKVEHRNKLIAV